MTTDSRRRRATEPVVLTPNQRSAILRDLAALWERDDVAATLAARDITTLYRVINRERGISQRVLAVLTGQSQSEISEILSGRRVTSYDLLTRIADHLGVPRGYMALAGSPAPCPRHDLSTVASKTTGNHATTTRHQTTVRAASMLPARWWNEPAMVAALANHDFAPVITFLDEHGLTTRDIASATGLPPDTVDCIAEGGSTLDSYRTLVRLADWLGIPRGHLGLGNTLPSDGTAQPELPTAWTGLHTHALRRALRQSVRDFSQLLDISQRMISKWESGGVDITPRDRNQRQLDMLLQRLDPAARQVYDQVLTQSAAKSAQPLNGNQGLTCLPECPGRGATLGSATS